MSASSSSSSAAAPTQDDAPRPDRSQSAQEPSQNADSAASGSQPSSSFTSYLWPFGSSSSSDGQESTSSKSQQSPPLRRRPSYEEFRSHEPPQARLIRLRGLFDKLLDKSGESALADGRAKDAWTKSAIRARLGAGLKAEEPGSSSSSSSSRATAAAADQGDAASISTGSKFSPPSEGQSPLPPPQPSERTGGQEVKHELRGADLPQPSYATELLAKCKRSHGAHETERRQAAAATQVRKEAVAASSSSSSSSSSAAGSSSSSSSSSSSFLGGFFSSSQPSMPATLSLPLSGRDRAADASRDGEAGWVGSGVWGLTAVSLDHLEEGPSESSSASSRSSAAAAAAEQARHRSASAGEASATAEEISLAEEREKAEREEADGVKQRRIEWEGFLKYAEDKERELYSIFQDLDKNEDGVLDIGEIRAALARAGIDLGSVPLEDFTASLASSRSYPSPTVAGLSEGSLYVTFPEFRDYLLLLPRRATMPEIFRFYQVRKTFGLFIEGGVFEELGRGWGRTKRGAAVVNFDGDVSLAGEEKMKGSPSTASSGTTTAPSGSGAAHAAAAPGVEASSRASLHPDPTNKQHHHHHHHGAGHSSEGDDHTETAKGSSQHGASAGSGSHSEGSEEEEEEEEEDDDDSLHPEIAVKFLLAGGIAGAVSRTATAPFDRLKVYLITSAQQSAAPDLASGAKAVAEAAAQAGGGIAGAASGVGAGAGVAAAQGGQAAVKGAGLLTQAIYNLYREGGGLKAFWVGNGLNVVKIFPESAIKFMSYEMSKRAFAKYVDGVTDSRDISGTSRFLSGGIGGITSQLAIYPIETLKTRLMASQKPGQQQKLLLKTARDMYNNGGLRLYYRGLTAGLIGVFPYSAIDMSAFEGIKLFYIKYTGKEEPGVLALLAFGSISGSVGATTVYPLNLIRTRLQAAGTPAHPQTYDGFLDAVRRTYKNEGLVGFYRGLVPTLAKVVPAVSISYVVYEHVSCRCGILPRVIA
ncbi:hypothetical protein V8E36_003592 [Tilletia maclaganii]